MQDRFKFRVLDVKDNKFCDLTRDDVLFFISNDGRLCRCVVYNVDGEISYFLTYPDEKYFKVVFCTGLKDSEVNLIFEGDIFTSSEYPFTSEDKPNYVGEVVWIDEFANFQYLLHCVNPNKRGIAEGINSLLEDMPEDAKVIGNIYENTELMERRNAE